MCIFCVLKLLGLSSGLLMIPVTLFAASSSEPSGNMDAKYPRLNEGNMFVVRLVPKAGRAEVYVLGKESAAIEMTEVGLSGSIRIGDKTWAVNPSKRKDHFEIVTPKGATEDYELKLRVNRSGKAEEFDFQGVPVRSSGE